MVRRRIYCYFMHREGWHISFLEADCKTSLPKKLTFADKAKLWELAEHGGCDMVLEVRQGIERGIERGRGGFWLNLIGQSD